MKCEMQRKCSTVPDHDAICLRGTKYEILWDLTAVPDIGSSITQSPPRKCRLVKPLVIFINRKILPNQEPKGRRVWTYFGRGEASIPRHAGFCKCRNLIEGRVPFERFCNLSGVSRS
jgi:hypothetical protein